MEIIQYIKSGVPLSERAGEGLAKLIRRKIYSAKEMILPVENTSKQIYFIEQGIARVFYSKNNKDVTLYFLQENNFGVPIDSIFYNQVCRFGIEALKETKVAVMQYEHWDTFLKADDQLQPFAQKLMIDYIKKATDRIYNLKFQTPKERYEGMLKDTPAIITEAPLGHIASYLGITQETLSRLRAKNHTHF